MTEDVRWKQRFENFEKAYLLLKGSLENKNFKNFSILEKQGVIQQFEVALELAWKVLKDYLADQKYDISPLSPKNVIKIGFQSGVLQNGEKWMKMLDDRNMFAHAYTPQHFEKAMHVFKEQYAACFEEFYSYFKGQK